MVPNHISGLISKSVASSCLFNVAPIPLLKNSLFVNSAPVFHFLNISLDTGYVPTALKNATVMPRFLKKSLLLKTIDPSTS